MSVLRKINQVTNSQDFFTILIIVILSSLFIGYAPASIALGIFVFFCLKHGLTKRRLYKPSIEMVLPILLYFLLVLTLFWTIDQKLSIKGLGRLVSLFLIPFSFLLIPKLSIKNQKKIFQYFTYSNALYAVFFLIVAVIKYITTKQTDVFFYHNLVSILDLNAIYVSAFFMISIFYLLSIKQKNNRSIALVSFLSFFILLLSSKLFLFILALTFVLYFIKTKSFFSKKTIYATIVVLILASIGSKSIFNRILEEKTSNFKEVIQSKKFNKVYLWTGTSFRLFQSRLFFEQIKEEKIFWKGFGVFASRIDLKKRHQKYNTYQGFHQYNYHNQYWQIMAESGFFGLLILLSILAIMYYRSIQLKHFVCFMFTITMSLLFLTESFLWVQRGLIFFTIYYSVFFRTNYNKLDLKTTLA